jgi:hypothetical protein
MLLLDPIFVDCLPKNLKILSNLPASQPASQQDGYIIEPQNQTVNGARRLQVLLKGRERGAFSFFTRQGAAFLNKQILLWSRELLSRILNTSINNWVVVSSQRSASGTQNASNLLPQCIILNSKGARVCASVCTFVQAYRLHIHNYCLLVS